MGKFTASKMKLIPLSEYNLYKTLLDKSGSFVDEISSPEMELQQYKAEIKNEKAKQNKLKEIATKNFEDKTQNSTQKFLNELEKLLHNGESSAQNTTQNLLSELEKLIVKEIGKRNTTRTVIKRFTKQSRMPIKKVNRPNTTWNPDLSAFDLRIIQNFPKTYKQSVENVIRRLKTNKSQIFWNENGEVFFNNQKLVGSNIHDYLSFILRPGLNFEEPPKGISKFISTLKEMNVPQTMIGKHMRSELGKTIEELKKRRSFEYLKSKSGSSSVNNWSTYENVESSNDDEETFEDSRS